MTFHVVPFRLVVDDLNIVHTYSLFDFTYTQKSKSDGVAVILGVVGEQAPTQTKGV